MTANIERGGQNPLGMAVAAGEVTREQTDDENVEADALDMEGEDAGTGAEGAGLAERERLGGLPGHEFDADDSVGAGVNAAGGDSSEGTPEKT